MITLLTITFLFRLIDFLSATIPTHGIVQYAKQLPSTRLRPARCAYAIYTPKDIARGIFDGRCQVFAGEKVWLDIKVGNLTGIVRIVYGTIKRDTGQADWRGASP